MNNNPSNIIFIEFYNIIKTLPAYPRASDLNNYHLGYIRYPEWNYECRQNSKLSLQKLTSHL